MYRLPLGDYFEVFIKWLTTHGEPFFDGLKEVVLYIVDKLELGLMILPWWLLLIFIAALAWKVSGKKLAILTVIGLALVNSIGLWDEMLETLALVLSSTLLALVIGIPLGIWMAKSETTERIVKPILDFMQTMPAFVYLIPAIPFFGLGPVGAIFSTVIFAMPPAIRLTCLGIKQVPVELVEAADSFGSTRSQKLFKLQLPMATPTIMAGINQTIMLALSMVVIAAMIGAKGLGGEVWKAIQRLEPDKGFEAGIAIVIVAIILDRIMQKAGAGQKTT